MVLTMLGLLPLITIGCQQEIPVALGDQDIPGVPVSVTVEIP